MSTSRLARIAVAATLRASQSHFRPPAVCRAAQILSSSSGSSFPPRSVNEFAVVEIPTPSCFSNILLSKVFARSYSTAASSGQINNSEFTEMAWDGVVGAVDAARANKQQVVQTEHLMKALLEQRDGLARRIFTKAGLDNTSVLQATEEFIAQQPMVSGDTSGPVLSSNLSSLLDAARKHKKEMGDSFVSVEHLLLSFTSDNRFGQVLFRNLQLTEKALRDAVTAVRGSQSVTDQNPEGKYEALEKYGNDLTELARRGKLDPVIGRDDEIRRCIQILCRRTKNNPVIIGEPGVGKTAIAEGLAQRIVRGDVPEPLLNRAKVEVELLADLEAEHCYNGIFQDHLSNYSPYHI